MNLGKMILDDLDPDNLVLFQNLNPRWHYVLEHKNITSWKKLSNFSGHIEYAWLDMSITSACMVGEAYCFTNNYNPEDFSHSGCSQCYGLSLTLGNLIDTFSEKQWGIIGLDDTASVYAGLMDTYLEHMKNNHKRLVQQKVKQYKDIKETLDKAVNNSNKIVV